MLMGTTGEGVTWDAVFDALRVEKRRTLLENLITESQADTTSEMVIDEEFDIEMYHCHLPKLASQGFIEWDEADQSVMAGENFEKVRLILEVIEEDEFDTTEAARET